MDGARARSAALNTLRHPWGSVVRRSREHVFPAPPERVFDLLHNLAQSLRWRKGLVIAEKLDARTARMRDVAGREWVEHVEDATAPAHLRIGVYSMNERPLYDIVIMLAPAPEGTRLRAQVRARGRTFVERVWHTLRSPTYKRDARERIRQAQAAFAGSKRS